MAGGDFTSKSVSIPSSKNSGGLNSTASPIGVEATEASDLQNIDFDRFGAFKKRNGTTRLNSVAANSGASCTSLHYFENRTADVFLGTFGDQLKKMEALDGTWDDITGVTQEFTGTGLDDGVFSGTLISTIAPIYIATIDALGVALTVDTIVQPTGALNNGFHAGITTTGGGNGALTVDVTIAGGVITVVTVATQGENYIINDTVTLSGLSAGGGGGNDDGTVDIASVADSFAWTKNGVSQATGVVITGVAQLLDSGISITFTSISGHTVNDLWTYYSALNITAGDDNLFTWITFNNTAYGVNGLDFPIKVDENLNTSNIPVPTGLTTAKYIESFENYMFAANVIVSGVARTTRIYWSALDNAELWDAADFNEVGLDDGEDITGIKKLGDRLVIYKERSIYVALFTGDADIPFVFKKSPSDIGGASGLGVQEGKNGHFFFAPDGIYFFDGFSSTKISDRITTTLDAYNSSKNGDAVSIYQKVKNKYWLSLTAGSNKDTIVTYDAFNNAFSIYDGINANAITIVNVAGEEQIYFGNTTGFVFRADVDNISSDKDDTNANVAIDAYYKTKWFDFGDLVLQKAVSETVFYYDFSNATLTFGYSYDLEEDDQFTQNFSLTQGSADWADATTTASNDGIWDISTWVKAGGAFYRIDHTGRGRLVRFNFSNRNIGEAFKINAFGLYTHLETHV